MTSYASAAIYSDGSSGVGLTIGMTISPVLYEIRLVRFEYGLVSLNFSSSGGLATISPIRALRYNTGTASGGTAVTPSPMRQGSAAASATSRFGTVTSSGTGIDVAQMPVLPWSDSPQSQNYDFPLDITVSPGGVVYFRMESYHSTGTMQIAMTAYFEELRMAWHY